MEEGDVMALQAGDDDYWDFLEVIRLPQDSLQDPLPLRVVPPCPAGNPASEPPDLPVSSGEPLLNFCVFNDDEFPTLGVAAGRRSDCQIYQAKDNFIVHRIRLKPADRPLCFHHFIERHCEVHIVNHQTTSWNLDR
jgi:hypothetical protein